MSYSILEFDDYENSPSEPHRKFAVLEQIARRRMNEIIDSTESGNLASEIHLQYMTLISSIANALDISGINYPENVSVNHWDAYQQFSLDVQGVIAKIMLNQDVMVRRDSVQLASSTKAKIEGQLLTLRRIIENSDMPTARRTKLIEQLDNFAAELNRPRLDFATVAMVATAFLAGIQGITSTLADAPNAYQTVGTILKWIGQDKEAEEKERLRLGPPPKMLPAPAKPQTSAPSIGFADDLDDDIPF